MQHVHQNDSGFFFTHWRMSDNWTSLHRLISQQESSKTSTVWMQFVSYWTKADAYPKASFTQDENSCMREKTRSVISCTIIHTRRFLTLDSISIAVHYSIIGYILLWYRKTQLGVSLVVRPSGGGWGKPLLRLCLHRGPDTLQLDQQPVVLDFPCHWITDGSVKIVD